MYRRVALLCWGLSQLIGGGGARGCHPVPVVFAGPRRRSLAAGQRVRIALCNVWLYGGRYLFAQVTLFTDVDAAVPVKLC